MESPTHSPAVLWCITLCVCTLSEKVDKGYQDVSFLFIKGYTYSKSF